MQIQLPKIVCILTMATKISTAWGLEKSKGCEYFLEYSFLSEIPPSKLEQSFLEFLNSLAHDNPYKEWSTVAFNLDKVCSRLPD